MSTKLKGDLAEQAAIFHALKRGWGVLKPVGDRLPYHLVFEWPGQPPTAGSFWRPSLARTPTTPPRRRSPCASAERGATDADYELVFDEIVVPVTRRFQPELVIISAGFDAHEADPLGGMRMSTAGFGSLTGRLCAAAGARAGGPAVLVTEGGYHLRAMAASLAASLSTMDERPQDGPAPAAGAPSGTRRGAEAVRRVRAAQAPYWGGL